MMTRSDVSLCRPSSIFAALPSIGSWTVLDRSRSCTVLSARLVPVQALQRPITRVRETLSHVLRTCRLRIRTVTRVTTIKYSSRSGPMLTTMLGDSLDVWHRAVHPLQGWSDFRGAHQRDIRECFEPDHPMCRTPCRKCLRVCMGVGPWQELS